METAVLLVPTHRCQYLSSAWEKIQVVVTIQRKIEAEANYVDGKVILTTKPETPDPSDLPRCARFIQAIINGFSVPAATQLLHRDNIFIDSLNITEISNDLQDDIWDPKFCFLSLYGNFSKKRTAIEQLTKTTIFVDRNSIYMLGTLSAIKEAKDLICGHISRTLAMQYTYS